MDKKFIIIISAACVLIIGSLLVWYFYLSNATPSTEDVFSAQLNGQKLNDEKVVLRTAQGDLQINNIFRSAKLFEQGELKSYKIGESIEYSVGKGEDVFILTSTNGEKGLVAIEDQLIQALGIQKEDGCKLTVLEYTKTKNDGSYVRNTLSFCKK